MAKKNGKPAEAESVEESSEVVQAFEPTYSATAKSKEKMMTVKCGTIILRQAWNSRKEATIGETKKDPSGEEWPDNRLDASIRGRLEDGKSPLINDPEVELLKDGSVQATSGFRRIGACVRIDPEMEIQVKVRATTGDPKQDDLDGRFDNLIENVQRTDLRPWELAEGFFQLTQHHPEIKAKQIAEKTGLGDRYISNLLRVRRKLCPELWEEYRQKGESMRVNDLIKVCSKPAEEQVDAYNAILRGESETEDEDEKKRKKTPKFKTWLKQTEKQLAKQGLSRDREKYLKGMAFALQCVTGEEDWVNPGVAERERRQAAEA